MREHIRGIYKHHGAFAIWDHVDKVGLNTWLYREHVHDRDYRSFDVAQSEPTVMWQALTSGSGNILNTAPVSGFSLSHSFSGSSNPYCLGGELTNVTHNVGYDDVAWNSNTDENGNSPLVKRREHPTGTAMHTNNASFEFDNAPLGNLSYIIGTANGTWVNSGSPKEPASFPFTLEAWAKPTATVTGTGHNMVFGLQKRGIAGVAESTHRFWGIGFREGSVGLPCAMWGNWTDVYAAGPDPFRSPTPNASTAADGKWHQIVAVFHNQSKVQLFYDGREVGGYDGGYLDVDLWNTNSWPQNLYDAGGVEIGRKDMNHNHDMAQNPGIAQKFVSGTPGTDEVPYIENPGDAGSTLVPVAGSSWFLESDSSVSTKRRYRGKAAAMTVYNRALSTEEVFDRYMTMTQGMDLVLKTQNGTVGGDFGVRSVIQLDTWGAGSRRVDMIEVKKKLLTGGDTAVDFQNDSVRRAMHQAWIHSMLPYDATYRDEWTNNLRTTTQSYGFQMTHQSISDGWGVITNFVPMASPSDQSSLQWEVQLLSTRGVPIDQQMSGRFGGWSLNYQNFGTTVDGEPHPENNTKGRIKIFTGYPMSGSATDGGGEWGHPNNNQYTRDIVKYDKLNRAGHARHTADYDRMNVISFATNEWFSQAMVNAQYQGTDTQWGQEGLSDVYHDGTCFWHQAFDTSDNTGTPTLDIPGNDEHLCFYCVNSLGGIVDDGAATTIAGDMFSFYDPFPFRVNNDTPLELTAGEPSPDWDNDFATPDDGSGGVNWGRYRWGPIVLFRSGTRQERCSGVALPVYNPSDGKRHPNYEDDRIHPAWQALQLRRLDRVLRGNTTNRRQGCQTPRRWFDSCRLMTRGRRQRR